jgi:hypothetical protein
MRRRATDNDLTATLMAKGRARLVRNHDLVRQTHLLVDRSREQPRTSLEPLRIAELKLAKGRIRRS